MDPTLEAFLHSWPFDPWIVVPLLLTAAIYVRGWRQLRRRGARRFGGAQLLAFLGGLAALFLALASPIDAFAGLLLLIHMVQHLLLMMVAPPLLWLGTPLLPLLRGVPLGIRRNWVGPLFRSALLRGVFRTLTGPVVAWMLFSITMVVWHVPRFYELALLSNGWHYVEHICFLGTASLFWWPVIQPYPSHRRFSPWVLLPYLFLADLLNTVLSAILAFSDRVLYPQYEMVPRLWGLSALEDQSIAGALMWVLGSLAYLIPLVYIGGRLLYGEREAARSVAGADSSFPVQPEFSRIALPVLSDHTRSSSHRLKSSSRSWDLLHLPLLGSFLHWRHARLAMQLPLFLLAASVIYDGLTGPQLAPLNLAGVLPWIHWRGLVVLGLLVAGNAFCMACPFLLPRTVARRWLPARWSWPRRLRSKWLAAGLLVTFFAAYETLSLWSSPWWTAWIALGYFLTAFVIDGWFRGAAFCKYVCPIGQFNFVQSLVSPLQVRVRDPEVCQQCQTKDCIRGRDGVPGCELHLFQPRKHGNMDCTFCLDCIHACPHDNIGIMTVNPGADLLHDPYRSGVGRWSRRPDLAALVLILVFAAFANAAAMVAPVVEFEYQVAAAFDLERPTLVTMAGFLAFLLLVPFSLVGTATTLSRRWSGEEQGWLEIAARFSFALVPLGAGMWLAHYTFHLFTSAGTAIPAAQRLAGDLGMPFLGPPVWSCSCSAAVAPWLLKLQILFLDGGFLLSLYAAYRIAEGPYGGPSRAVKAFLPWAAISLFLFALGIWIVLQPMEMRGTMTG